MPVMSIHNEDIKRESKDAISLPELLNFIDEFRTQIAKRDPNQEFKAWLCVNEHAVEFDLFPM